MASVAVRMVNIVHLEAEGVLQVVARLLLGESGHDGRSLRDVHDCKIAGVIRDLVRSLLISGRTSPELRGLAQRCGIT
jgi:hypothetical protein